MRYLFRFLIVLIVFGQSAVAGDAAVLDGEAFTKRFVANPPNGDRLIEFVREGESLENWTRLVGYRYQQLPALGNDPRQVVVRMAQALKATNPDAQYQVIASERSSDAIIDFLTWPDDQRYLEFNVFRYVRDADGKAVLSLQFAYRFTDITPEGLEAFKDIRKTWIDQAVAYDMRHVQLAFSR